LPFFLKKILLARCTETSCAQKLQVVPEANSCYDGLERALSSSTNPLPYPTDKGGYSTHDTLVLLGIGFCVTSVSVLVIVLCERLCCRRRGTVAYVAARPIFLHGGAGAEVIRRTRGRAAVRRSCTTGAY
jgi:hypothetical protein